MNDQLDLRDLRYFETIAQLGHLGRAAQKLSRTQPALTGCVRRLEASLGTRLFERSGRGIRLTQAGEVLLVRARLLQLAAQDTVREMHNIAQGVRGQVRVGLVQTAAQLLLPPVCRQLLAEAPEVTLKTTIAQNDVLNASLKAGELDLVIGFDERVDNEFVSHAVLFEDVVVVAASSKHPIFRKRVKMQDLLAYRWVLAAPSVDSRRWLERAFDLHGLPRPLAHVETNFVLLLPPLIAQTGLLSFISRRHLGPGRLGATLREVTLRETTMRRALKVMFRKNSYLSPAARRLIDVFCAQGKALFQTATRRT